MTIQIAYASILALLTLAILIRAAWLKVETDDVPCTYKLYAVRDAMIRLIVEGKIRRDDPHFRAMYENINTLLRSSRVVAGPDGWALATWTGKTYVHDPEADARLLALPGERMPCVLEPVAQNLSSALHHLVNNHLGVLLQIDADRRERMKIQKRQAERFLAILPSDAQARAC